MVKNQGSEKRNNYVVDEGLKVDFHIHSCYSSHKESRDVAAENTLENLPTLIDALNKNGVNMTAITDHDVFSYEMYKRLKAHEGNGCLKKVLPGVEFSVAMHAEKSGKNAKEVQTGVYAAPVHVIALFDDAEPNKLEAMEEILGDGMIRRPNYDSTLTGFYKEETFISLLARIGLNVVLIAHQKRSLNSMSSPAKDDLNGVGKKEFNYYLFAEYFQALEFKNRKNEIQNIKCKQQYSDDLLRFITGSDCHDWAVYPLHDKSESNPDNFRFTYFKCLPTFRGVAMALTGSDRISLVNSFFNVSDKTLSNIDLAINGAPVSIPLSRGINVIIGDNSIGKSLLLHKLTDYYRENSNKETSGVDGDLKRSYERYLSEHAIEVKTRLPRESIYGFDTQGEISRKFSLKKLKFNDFIHDLSLSTPEIEKATNSLRTFTTDYLKDLKGLANKHSLVEKLKWLNVKVSDNSFKGAVLKAEMVSDKASKTSKQNEDDIIAAIQGLILKLEDLLKILTDEDEKKEINKFKDYLALIKSKHENFSCKLRAEIQLIADINSVLRSFDQVQQKTDDDKMIENRRLQVKMLGEGIKGALNSLQIKDFSEPHISEPIFVEPVSTAYGKYKIVTYSPIDVIDDAYLLSLFSEPLKKNGFLKENFLSDESLSSALSSQRKGDPWALYEQVIIEKIKKDFHPEIKIVLANDPDEKDYSSGFNDRMYFAVLASDVEHSGVYLIDQPEDDVSQKAIKDYLIEDMRTMAKTKQVIMITHNPQFVVNLDVDNVIYLHRDNGLIGIDYGALEYQGDGVDILKDVADTLDGGAITIQRRWKKYEKNFNDIED